MKEDKHEKWCIFRLSKHKWKEREEGGRRRRAPALVKGGGQKKESEEWRAFGRAQKRMENAPWCQRLKGPKEIGGGVEWPGTSFSCGKYLKRKKKKRIVAFVFLFLFGVEKVRSFSVGSVDQRADDSLFFLKQVCHENRSSLCAARKCRIAFCSVASDEDTIFMNLREDSVFLFCTSILFLYLSQSLNGRDEKSATRG